MDAIRGIEAVKASTSEGFFRQVLLNRFLKLAQQQFRADFFVLTYEGLLSAVTFLSAIGFLCSRRGLGFTLGPQARQTVRPNRVRHPTDGSFASSCFPPRLAATQFLLAIGRSRSAWKGLAPL